MTDFVPRTSSALSSARRTTAPGSPSTT